MKLRIVAIVVAAALFAIPGSASQPSTEAQRLVAMQAELGFDLNPHAATALSITLPSTIKDVMAL